MVLSQFLCRYFRGWIFGPSFPWPRLTRRRSHYRILQPAFSGSGGLHVYLWQGESALFDLTFSPLKFKKALGLRQMVLARFSMGYWTGKIPALFNLVAVIGWSSKYSIDF